MLQHNIRRVETRDFGTQYDLSDTGPTLSIATRSIATQVSLPDSVRLHDKGEK